MRNVTVTLDEETVRWARIEAARRDMSLSRFIREILRERMEDRARYEDAMRRYLSRGAGPLRREAIPYPTRDEVHSRAGLR